MKLHLIQFLCIALTGISSSVAWAFPPAPDFTLFGTLRDEVGQRLEGNGTAFVLLLIDNQEISRTPLISNRLDSNYELKIKVDANRPGTVLYRSKALPAGSAIEIAVEINRLRFYPIEATGNLNIGQGGERQRLNLTLGDDSDLDGLPDTWEEWQLFNAGISPNADGAWDLSLIDRDGDLDNDGQSNGNEYIAGTFAGDATETFSLTIERREGTSSLFTFYQVTGKTYTLERKLGSEPWQKTPFREDDMANPAMAHVASKVGLTHAEVIDDEPVAIYRLTVQ